MLLVASLDFFAECQQDSKRENPENKVEAD
jgi:hypothetical protein